ncbi:hypothetical protein H0H92_015483 [Tricholoma furcatifolium]|nr:hypothetical protein H0H92_015483 [Tricholoma furcatifolium]
MSSSIPVQSTWGIISDLVQRASTAFTLPRSSASSQIVSVEPGSGKASLEGPNPTIITFATSDTSDVTQAGPDLHEFGWIEYRLSDDTVYYVHPTRRVTADIDLRDKGNLAVLHWYFESHTDGTSAPAGTELWLVQGGEPKVGGQASKSLPVRLLVDHRQRMVTVDQFVYAKAVPGTKVGEDDNQGHPAHHTLPPSAKAEAMDVLTWSYTEQGSGESQAVIEELIARLAHIFATKEDYRRLLSCRGTNAQKLLNMFQELLDLMDNQPTRIHRNFIVAAQRLAGASGLYPICYKLDGLTDPGVYECSGGFADVYKANLRGQVVCLKTVRLNSRTDSERFLKIFSKEAILWGQLRHPNILPFYGIFRVKERLSMVAPWMENGDVSKYLKNNKSSNRVLLSLDVGQGLQFLHENDIVHGDLKAGNILVNDFGRACLADLGLSSISDKEILAWTSHSSVGSKGGTIRWQAPELFNPEGDEEVHNTKASDIYAWACVAYEIFTGEIPLSHLTRDATVIHKVLSGERPKRPSNESLSWSVWGLTENIWKLMETCWDSDPVQRPNASVVVETLQAALPKDLQRDEKAEINSGSLSPSQFRAMARRGGNKTDLSVELLESLLANQQ